MTPLPQVTATGPALALYDGGGIQRAWAGAERLVLASRPPVVILWAWPGPRTTETARALRAAHPGVETWLGVGVDGIGRHVADGSWSVARGVAPFVQIARGAVALGATTVMWDAEARHKARPGTPQRARLEALAHQALLVVRDACPGLVQTFTSYDHPSYHADFPWRPWLGPESPIVAAFAQVYPAPGGGLRAHQGALPAREARALASWGSAVRAGWIRPDVPEGQPGDDRDVDWMLFEQLHSNDSVHDLVTAGVASQVCAGWAAPTRCDPVGEQAWRALCELHRRGFWGAGAVGRFQLAAGLLAPGAPTLGTVGPRTLAALGVT